MLKRTLQPDRVVCGHVGDFGVTIWYENRGKLLKDIRRSIAFATRWLRAFVLDTKLPATYRLRRRLHENKDIVDREQYLRFNIEYRFRQALCYQLMQCTRLVSDLNDIVLSFL